MWKQRPDLKAPSSLVVFLPFLACSVLAPTGSAERRDPSEMRVASDADAAGMPHAAGAAHSASAPQPAASSSAADGRKRIPTPVDRGSSAAR